MSQSCRTPQAVVWGHDAAGLISLAGLLEGWEDALHQNGDMVSMRLTLQLLLLLYEMKMR